MKLCPRPALHQPHHLLGSSVEARTSVVGAEVISSEGEGGEAQGALSGEAAAGLDLGVVEVAADVEGVDAEVVAVLVGEALLAAPLQERGALFALQVQHDLLLERDASGGLDASGLDPAGGVGAGGDSLGGDVGLGLGLDSRLGLSLGLSAGLGDGRAGGDGGMIDLGLGLGDGGGGLGSNDSLAVGELGLGNGSGHGGGHRVDLVDSEGGGSLGDGGSGRSIRGTAAGDSQKTA